MTEAAIPDGLQDLVAEKKGELVERLAEVDDEIAELFLGEEVRALVGWSVAERLFDWRRCVRSLVSRLLRDCLTD